MEISPGCVFKQKRKPKQLFTHTQIMQLQSLHMEKEFQHFITWSLWQGVIDIKCAKYATYGTRELSKNIIKALKQ